MWSVCLKPPSVCLKGEYVSSLFADSLLSQPVLHGTFMRTSLRRANKHICVEGKKYVHLGIRALELPLEYSSLHSISLKPFFPNEISRSRVYPSPFRNTIMHCIWLVPNVPEGICGFFSLSLSLYLATTSQSMQA